MYLSEKLKGLRAAKGASLQDVADAVGVSRTAILNMETGQANNPKLKVLLNLSDYYGMSIDELVRENAFDHDRHLWWLFQEACAIDERDRALLENIIKAMLAAQKGTS